MVTATKSHVRDWGFYLDGKWISEGQSFEIRAPYDGSIVGTGHLGSSKDAEKAVVAAVRAFETIRRMPAFERQAILRQISDSIRERAAEFSSTIAQEAGKPIRTARAEVERASFTFAVAAEEAVRIGGEWLPLDWQESASGRGAIVRRFPLGPVLGITPFNFPLNLVAHKVAPAIAAGCPIVLKPAPQTPLTSFLLAEVISQTAWPAGAFSVLPLLNEDAEKLVRDDRLKLLSFTGSAAVGWALKAKAGKKKIVLELGGNAAVIVHSDADVEDAARRCVSGGFSYAGQSCISVQRILVHQSIFKRFTESVLERVATLKVGDPMDEAIDVGPMINEAAARRAEGWIQEAVAGGAKVLIGGNRQGSLLEPAVLANVKSDMKVCVEEVFAPVVIIDAYETFEEAIRRVNESGYGLQTGIFTRDMNLIMRAFEELEVGGVIVGDSSAWRIDHMPYGGVKDSGMGREGLRYAIEDMTERRILVLNLT